MQEVHGLRNLQSLRSVFILQSVHGMLSTQDFPLTFFFFQTNSATGLDNIAEYRTKAQTLQSIQQCLTETEKHIRNLYGITEVDNSLLE